MKKEIHKEWKSPCCGGLIVIEGYDRFKCMDCRTIWKIRRVAELPKEMRKVAK